MRRIAYWLAPLALVACVDDEVEIGDVSGAATVVTTGPTTGPTTSVDVWHKWTWGESVLPARLVPVGCDYFATIYSKATDDEIDEGNGFTVYGVCTRPSLDVRWQISGTYAQFKSFERRFAGEIEREASAGIDLGTGGNGVITKLGPKGPGPVGQRVRSAALALDTTFQVGWPAGTNLLTTSSIVVGPVTTPSGLCPSYPANLVPDDCESFTVVLAKKSASEFRASGICARPDPSVVWKISGSIATLSCLRGEVAGEVATQSQLFGDVGYGGNGVITKLGPKGPGPVGSDDNLLEQALELDTQLVERWELEVAAPPPTDGSCLPGEISCPIVSGP